MVDSQLEAEKGEENGVIDIQDGSKAKVLRREPSFSGWYDEDGIKISNCHLDNDREDIEESDFELPLLPSAISGNMTLDGENLHQRTIHSNGAQIVEGTPDDIDRSGNRDKFTPFDIENGSTRDVILNINGDDQRSKGRLEITTQTESTISSATVLKTLFFILIWYTFSTFLTLYNKTLLGDKLGKFPAPLLMNTFHFVLQAVLSKAITWYWSQRYQPSVKMTWRDYFMRVVPTALGTALDINLSNASLVFISVTFATMCKSGSPIFLLLFAFAFRLETPSFKLLGIIVIISAGVLLTVAKEAEFEIWGFIFVMLASVMSGFRWSMTQILLQKEAYGLHNPITLMSYVTPVMAVATALLSLILDPWHEFKQNNYFNSSWHVLRSCLLMFVGGTLAFFMVLTEYILVSATSAVTVTIAGVVKEAVTILVAVFYFHDQFTWLKGAGLFTIMIGVGLFNWYKYRKLQKSQTMDKDEAVPSNTNGAGKYVILDEMDDLDDGT
ncbi:hypothetical protein Syun_008919 [Stephania yunnanensis]|uniref:Sugar phosphate transporter domain-containing protein n=1 Tax=Stephania yunnanensis TaxID=152371 RepID=A0AAP0PQF3_9MAGN